MESDNNQEHQDWRHQWEDQEGDYWNTQYLIEHKEDATYAGNAIKQMVDQLTPQDLWDTVPEQAERHNDGKVQLSYLDRAAVEGLARVLMFGAEKYDRDNWRMGMHYSQVLDSMLRHVFAMLAGEEFDPESGLPHIDHVGCNWMFLSNFTKTKREFNDLFITKTTGE